MIRSLFLFFCLSLLLLSCEDKETSNEKNSVATSEEVKEIDTLKKDPEEELKKARPEGPLVVQEELIPFYTKYAKEHDENKVRIKTRFGNIDVALYKDTPLHRANFLFLVKNDYFDDTFFHRVAKDFVIQGGNSDNPETNQKRHYIGDFLIPNEADAGHKHVRGALSASKYAEQNVSKASSPYEFFIVQSRDGAHHLDGEHTVFGRVIDGMKVVDSIAQVKVDGSEWPLHNIYLEAEIID